MMHKMGFAAMLALATSFSAGAAEGTGKSWDFTPGQGFNGWTLGNFQSKEVTAGGLTAFSGKDCQMAIKTDDAMADELGMVEIVMKADKNSGGQIFFTTAAAPTLSEKASVRFPVKAGDDFQTYRIDCAANPLWTGSISQVRLDPVATAGLKVEIKSIKLLP